MTPARAAYTAFAFFAVPFAALYLLWRSRRQPEYRQHWSERFGFKHYAHYAPDAARPTIWIHAVSLGETRAAEPLIDALAQRYPHLHFLLTHMTPTGRAAGADVAARWPDRVMQTYLPYDLPYAIRRFLRAFKPVAGVTIETEIWPNLMAIAAEAGVPMALVNARLSERSYQSYLRFAQLMREAAARFKWVLAQTEADSARLRKLGANEVEVTGNIKFDSAPDQVLVARGAAWRRACGRPVWLFASTRDSEEALIL
ncbi:MAG: 3-deoxy-D-manno-octulosonic acid transferase, partial [Pseudomonadota bacterium]|nr:3-deoxy-D-manno-octulosonic acid transferase [Pseudomonadota bacterium]